jgi:hypothetical protein
VTRQQQLAWAAGYFDARGSIVSLYDGTVTLQIRTVDRDKLQRFADIVQLGTMYGPYSGGDGRQDVHMWVARSHKALVVFDELRPYLSNSKRERCTKAFTAHEVSVGSPT